MTDEQNQEARAKLISLRTDEESKRLAAHEAKARSDQAESAWNQAGAEFMEHAKSHQRVIIELMQAEKDYVTELLKN